jgi:hypothetical protein
VSPAHPGDRICILAGLKGSAQYVPSDGVTITNKTAIHTRRQPSVILLMEDYAHRVSGIPTIRLEHTTTISCPAQSQRLVFSHQRCLLHTHVGYNRCDNLLKCLFHSAVFTTFPGKPKRVDVNHRGLTNGQFIVLITPSHSHLAYNHSAQ